MSRTKFCKKKDFFLPTPKRRHGGAENFSLSFDCLAEGGLIHCSPPPPTVAGIYEACLGRRWETGNFFTNAHQPPISITSLEEPCISDIFFQSPIFCPSATVTSQAGQAPAEKKAIEAHPPQKRVVRYHSISLSPNKPRSRSLASAATETLSHGIAHFFQHVAGCHYVNSLRLMARTVPSFFELSDSVPSPFRAPMHFSTGGWAMQSQNFRQECYRGFARKINPCPPKEGYI